MCEQAAAVYAETGVKALAILGLDKPDELTKQDLVLFLYAIGLNPTDDVIDSKLRFLKLHQREVITFPQVCHVWHSMLQDLTDEDAILRRAFQYFDKDGNGEISVIELRTTMHELGDLLTESELLSFMQVVSCPAVLLGNVLKSVRDDTAAAGRELRVARVTLVGQDGLQLTFDGILVGVDKARDLAVLRINAAPEQLVPVTLGSSEGLR
ncbi:uncharacterized protein HaLaN_22972, partial [Haematococcus lacustris]